MATFSIKVKEYDIVSCTQVQTVIVIMIPQTKVDIDKDGNGSIKLSALNTDEAMNFALKQLDIYKATQSH